MKIIWIKVLIISMTAPPKPITHSGSHNPASEAVYLYRCVNPTYTSDTVRLYANMKYHVGDSVEVGIYPNKRTTNK